MRTKTRERRPKSPPPDGINPTAVYRPAEAAALLRIDVKELREHAAAGRIRCKVKSTRQRVYLGAWLIAWVES